MKRTLALLLAVMLLLSAFVTAYAATGDNSSTGGTAVTTGLTEGAEVPLLLSSNPFVDVNETHFFYESVLWAVEQGITSGISATEFGPTLTCTRAQVVTFLWRYAGSPKPASARNSFTDVEVGLWYSDAILWAVEQGITSGISSTQFAPNQPCNRAQVVTFLWRFQQQPEPSGAGKPFTDVESGSWYEKAVLWAQERGITTGTSATTFSPNGLCQRAQVVTFLYRTAKPTQPKPEPEVGELVIKTATDTVVYVGESLQIEYTYTGDKSALTWTSGDTSVLTVNSSGKVTAVSAGKTRVYIYHGDTQVGRVRLVIEEKPAPTEPKPVAKSIKASSFTGPYFDGIKGVVGNYMTFKAYAKADDDGQAVTAKSSDTSVATVERTSVDNGNVCKFKVKFKGSGSCTITLTSEDGNASKSYTLTVKGSYSSARSGQLSPEEFVECVNGIMKENGATISTSMGYRVETFSDDELTGSRARNLAEGYMRDFWPDGISSMGLSYQGTNEDGKHVFYIHR